MKALSPLSNPLSCQRNDQRDSHLKAYSLMIGLTLCLVACGKKTTALPAEEIVSQRVLERWAIRQAGNTDGLYDYLSPAMKQLVDKAAYEAKFGNSVSYTNVKITGITCNQTNETPADSCQVAVYVSIKLGDALGGSPLKETWVLQDDQWWMATMK